MTGPPGRERARTAVWAVPVRRRFVHVADADTASTIQSLSVATANSSGVFASAVSAGTSSATGSTPLAIAIAPTGHPGFTRIWAQGAPSARGLLATGNHPSGVIRRRQAEQRPRWVGFDPMRFAQIPIDWTRSPVAGAS
jgi:hypothetical protein